MIRTLILAIVMFGLGYLYGSNETLRVKTIELIKKLFEKIVELIKRLIAKIKGE